MNAAKLPPGFSETGISGRSNPTAMENSSEVTARAEEASLNVYPLTVEFVEQLPGVDGITQIVVRLPNNTPVGQTLFVSATLRGKTSNKVRIRMNP